LSILIESPRLGEDGVGALDLDEGLEESIKRSTVSGSTSSERRLAGRFPWTLSTATQY
jgi:hypothetical protein